MLLALCLTLAGSEPILDEAREWTARNRAVTLTLAARTHLARTGWWPRQLADVAAYPDVGEKNLVSPWGAPYQFVLAEDANGDVRPYVWTERVVNGEVRVYGTRLPAPKP